jgi:hypothetical protein
VAVNRLAWAVVFAGVLLAGIVLRAIEQPNWINSGLLVLAGLVFVIKVWRRRGE